MKTGTVEPAVVEQTDLALELLPGDEHDFVLDAVDKEQAAELMAAHPEVVTALREFNECTDSYIGAFRNLIVRFREAKLIGRECQLVLASAGWAKSRISEAKRIIESDDRTFKRFADAEIGVRLALKEAREALPESAGREYRPKELVSFFTASVNGYNGPKPKKTVRLNAERLDCVFQLVVKPKKIKATKGKQ